MNIVQTFIKVAMIIFFFRKSLEICSGSNLLFRGSTFDFFFFEVQFISFIKGKSNSTIEQQKCKGHEQFNRILQLI